MRINNELAQLMHFGQRQIEEEQAALKHKYEKQQEEYEAETKRMNDEWLRVALENIPASLHDFIKVPVDDPRDRTGYIIDVIFSFEELVPFLARIRRDREDAWYLDAYYISGIVWGKSDNLSVYPCFDEDRCDLVKLFSESYSLGYVLAVAKNTYNYLVNDRNLIVINDSEIRIKIT